jgi:hypothetical protein
MVTEVKCTLGMVMYMKSKQRNFLSLNKRVNRQELFQDQCDFKYNLIKYIVAKILHILSHTWMTLTMLLGRVSKLVTNGSKTIVMNVIGFLCVSLGSSTVQLHDSLGTRCACSCSEAGFSSQSSNHA